jgi:hypothetical protein
VQGTNPLSGTTCFEYDVVGNPIQISKEDEADYLVRMYKPVLCHG